MLNELMIKLDGKKKATVLLAELQKFFAFEDGRYLVGLTCFNLESLEVKSHKGYLRNYSASFDGKTIALNLSLGSEDDRDEDCFNKFIQLDIDDNGNIVAANGFYSLRRYVPLELYR